VPKPDEAVSASRAQRADAGLPGLAGHVLQAVLGLAKVLAHLGETAGERARAGGVVLRARQRGQIARDRLGAGGDRVGQLLGGLLRAASWLRLAGW
jgi:hypothetical protein